jgi:hypothetical protein
MRRLGILFALLSLSFGASAEGLTAEQLIAKVEAAQKTSGFRTRARLVKSTPDSKTQEVMQLVIKGRREGGAIRMLYQVLWPKQAMGQALVVETSADGSVTGFLFEPPDRRIPLTPKVMPQPLFGTNVTVEDVAEAYWHWPHQKLVGEEKVAGRLCMILESRPGPGTATGYSLVRSWIAPDIALPLMVEKYGKERALLKRFVAAKVVKQSPGSWAAAILVVDSMGGRGRTTLEGTKTDRDIDIPEEQFTLEALKKVLDPSHIQPPAK